MNRNILIYFLIFVIAGCTQISTSQDQTENINWIRDLSAAKQIAKSQGKPILIDFYTDWCGWCKRFDKDTYANEKVAKVAASFVCVKINADEHPQLAKDYNVRGFPSTAFLKSDGSIIEVVAGYMGPGAFLELLDRVLKTI